MFPDIRSGAVFIADAHYTDERTDLLGLLNQLQLSPPSQVFLMGDIFDLYLGPFSYLKTLNTPLIDAIERLAVVCEVWFFEGNHDFLLEGCMKGVRYVPLSQQPMVFTCESTKIALSHGDYADNLTHTLFTRLIRSRFTLGLLHLITGNIFGNWFIRYQVARLKKKRLCREFDGFEQHIMEKVAKNPPEAEVILEGHYHQGTAFETLGKRYVNVPGFACNQSYIVIESGQNTVQFSAMKYKR